MQNNKNNQAVHQFIKGWRVDLAEHAERLQSASEVQNLRLFSKNGTLSYSSIKGTKKVYENDKIIKYLGAAAFNDELIVLVKIKSDGYEESQSNLITEEEDVLILNSFAVTVPYNNGTSSAVNTDLENNSSIQTITIITGVEPPENPLDFQNQLICDPSAGLTIDYSGYFEEIVSALNYEVCSLDNTQSSYPNNLDYIDAFISIKKGEDNLLYGTHLWSGLLNWSMNAKIVCLPVFENNFYKRIYYTDYENPFRAINIKDPNLQYRRTDEFQALINTTLLQPEIILKDNNGQIKASTVFYAYRLLTQNGQSTEFSPFSEGVKINVGDGDLDFDGGDISQVSTKRVQIRCNVLYADFFNEIEAIAIEYEALGSPTSIRSLGVQNIANVNVFNHYGNESEFSEDITLAEILLRKNNWRYCSDLATKKSQLFVSGLRNDPLPTELLTISKDFALHGWDINGETHECLINPDPERYRYIDPTDSSNQFYVKQKYYSSIQVFGSFTISLKNETTGYTESFAITSNVLNYVEHITAIWEWLEALQTNLNFLINYPNTQITLVDNKILFSPVDELIETDFDKIYFQYNTVQVIEDVTEDLQFRDLDTVNLANLVYGGQSLGFNRGNGIRITFITEEEEVLTKATNTYPEEEPLLKIKEPSMSKAFFKGEIYRCGFQFFDNNGYQLFNIPIGDLKIPEIGDQIRYTDDNGNPVIEYSTYVNSKVVGDKMYAQRIKMKMEVRLSCELKKLVTMYQLTYVERDEANRTILCQGISAPLERMNQFFHSEHIYNRPEIVNKWCLPFNGGPTYDLKGLEVYDAEGEDYETSGYETSYGRIVTHRKLTYFDCPDLIYSKISSDRIINGFYQRIARLNTDHTPNAIRQLSGEVYPKFSRKIYRDELSGNNDHVPRMTNVSVFIERPGIKDLLEITHAEEANRGEIISQLGLDTSQDVSNNAFTLAKQSWYYSSYGRKSEVCASENGARSEIFRGNFSPGYSTVFIRTEEEAFSDEFIDQVPFNVVVETDHKVGSGFGTYDTHALVNIKMNTASSIYGGRTEQAYANNVFIALSTTVPVLQTSNNIQKTIVNGDTYTTLFCRLKNDYNDQYEPQFEDMNNSGGCRNRHEEEDYRRYGAWMYAVVLETQVEERLTYATRFYKEAYDFDFGTPRLEVINEAYFQENNIRSYIPKPFRYKDEPNMGNVIAVSEPKLTSDVVDAFTVFPVNNFYELERDKGVVHNLARQENDLFAIQENLTSKLITDPRTMVNTADGEIAIQQGTGAPIVDHQAISIFGTAIRRAVAESEWGFVFFDERKYEFVKISEPLLILNELHLELRALFENNPIVDTEAYYDDEFKESNIVIRTKSGLQLCISYNEIFKCFNGKYSYNQDIFINWNNETFAPKRIEWFDTDLNKLSVLSEDLHQLNRGEYLDIFDEKKPFVLEVVCNLDPLTVKIFKHIAVQISMGYPIKKFTILTSTGQERVIYGTHHMYKVREGIHTVPLKNRFDWEDLRGEWAKIKIEGDSLQNTKVDIFSFINFVRQSYI